MAYSGYPRPQHPVKMVENQVKFYLDRENEIRRWLLEQWVSEVEPEFIIHWCSLAIVGVGAAGTGHASISASDWPGWSTFDG